MKLFGNSKKKTETSTSSTVQESMARIRETIEMLDKREALCQKRIEMEVQKAKQFVQQKKKTSALLALKTKKHYEKELEKIMQIKSNLVTQQLTLEGAAVDIAAFDTMAVGAKALKAIHANLDVDKVDRIMDDIEDAMARKNEVTDAITRQLGPVYDEDELNQELEDLLMEEEATAVKPGTEVLDLPEVPTHVPVSNNAPVAADDDDEAEIAKLRMEMAM